MNCQSPGRYRSMMARSSDILFLTEYVKDVLYFAVAKHGKDFRSNSEVYYFSIDRELVYENYYSDFGPLNLGCVYKYCYMLNEKLKKLLNKQTIVHYTSVDPRKKANSAFLMGCFGVLYLNLTPRDALKPLTIHGQAYRSFQDATQGDSQYTISLLDCLQAIKKARDIGFFNFNDFDYQEYERLDKIQGGDLNWIVPGKFLALIGPVDFSVSLHHPPEMYIDYFIENNVKLVVRLNKRQYDRDVFRNAGISHCDLFFPDGSCPPKHILFKFLQMCEDFDGAIAVHCKAGLGRTGSLIGCYLIKHYNMTAPEAIGWMRICRPGSVIGHQQGWLQQLEPWLMKQGNHYRKRLYQDAEQYPVHKFGIYSMAEKNKSRIPQVVKKSSSPSPPPPIQRQIRSDTRPPVRPQASKVREAPNKVNESDKKLVMQKSSHSQTPSRGTLSERIKSASPTRRVINIGGGDPRSQQAQCNNSRSQKSSTKSQLSQDNGPREVSGFHPMPPLRLAHNPIIRNMNDAKNFLMNSNIYNEEKKKVLRSNIACSNKTSKVTPVSSQVTSSNFSNSKRSSDKYKRRLGRSPSPEHSKNPIPLNERSRATNTPLPRHTSPSPPPPTERPRYSKKISSREALADLLVKSTRDPTTFGASSVGASSAGPRHVITTSVRSDERPLATQGDMLNSIKLHRRLGDALCTERILNLKDKTRPIRTLSKALPASKNVKKENNNSKGYYY